MNTQKEEKCSQFHCIEMCPDMCKNCSPAKENMNQKEEKCDHRCSYCKEFKYPYCSVCRDAVNETCPKCSKAWHTELENLATTEPNPNSAVYNLPQLKEFISSLFSTQLNTIKERINGLKNTKEHICRFNDGEQNCDCYNQALTDILKDLD